MIEKHEECPKCGTDWAASNYDLQQCFKCGYNGMTGICPDFDMLRSVRNAAIETLVATICEKNGLDLTKTSVHISGQSGCYCDCLGNGPCEHEFSGWRELEDGRGGEQFCQKCGCGSMSHSMGFLP